jgi:hypothetical protein
LISVKIRFFLSLRTVQKIKIILITLFCCLSHNLSAQDTVAVSGAGKRVLRLEPMKATMMAVAFPGLGQVYNRKFWKVPFVYAGFGGLAYSISFNTSKYNEMMKAYQDFTDKIPETNSYATLSWLKVTQPSEYDPVLYPDTYDPSKEKWVEDNLIKSIDYYKKYRDLSYIGIAAWYLLTILDANVDASLSNFDVSDDLNIEVTPLQLPVPGVAGAGISISLIYTF